MVVANLYPIEKKQDIRQGTIAFTASPGEESRLDYVTVHFSAAPTTSENLTITLDVGEAGSFDVLLLLDDPSEDATTDYFWQPDSTLHLGESDSILVEYPNTDNEFVSVQVVFLVEKEE